MASTGTVHSLKLAIDHCDAGFFARLSEDELSTYKEIVDSDERIHPYPLAWAARVYCIEKGKDASSASTKQAYDVVSHLICKLGADTHRKVKFSYKDGPPRTFLEHTIRNDKLADLFPLALLGLIQSGWLWESKLDDALFSNSKFCSRCFEYKTKISELIKDYATPVVVKAKLEEKDAAYFNYQALEKTLVRGSPAIAATRAHAASVESLGSLDGELAGGFPAPARGAAGDTGTATPRDTSGLPPRAPTPSLQVLAALNKSGRALVRALSLPKAPGIADEHAPAAVVPAPERDTSPVPGVALALSDALSSIPPKIPDTHSLTSPPGSQVKGWRSILSLSTSPFQQEANTGTGGHEEAFEEAAM